VKNAANPRILSRALPVAAQVYLGLKPAAPRIRSVSPGLSEHARRLSRLVRSHSHAFKVAGRRHRESIVTMEAVQARIADNAMLLFALAASLSKADALLRSGAAGPEFDRDYAAFEHAFDLFELRILGNLRELKNNADGSMRRAAEAARRHNDTLPTERFYVHEGSPVARGQGKPVVLDHIPQFPGNATEPAGGDGQDSAVGARRGDPAAS